MTKIGFVMEELWIGGGPRNVYTLSELLKKEKIDSSIISLTDQSKFFGIKTRLPQATIKTFLTSSEPLSSLSLVSIGLTYKVSSLFLPLEFAIGALDLLFLNPFDVYIATSWRTLYPVSVVSRHNNTVPLYFVQAYEVEFNKDKIGRMLSHKTYILSTVKFTHSMWVKKYLETVYKDEVYYIGMGINHDVFHTVNFSSPKPKILTIARAGSDKGFNIFVKAINYLYKIRKDFNVIIIGEKQALNHQSMNFPYMFKGWINSDLKLAELYRESIFVNTGRHEALPMPPLEAMACGSAVVLTDMPGNQEFAQDHRNCLLSPVGDYKKIAQNINELLSNEILRKEILKNAVETAKRYDWKIVIERFKYMLKDIGVL